MIFSVIAAFLNEEQYIARCIRSLLSQDFERGRYEISIVDNGSTDASWDMVKRYPDIVLLEEEIPNEYAARNKGLRAARGEIIAFTNADC